MTGRPVKRRRGLRRAFAIALAATAVAYVAGFVWFAEDIPRVPPNDRETTDAIVVLTGGQHRLNEGLELLAQGRAAHLFVSGVNRGVELGELLRVAGSPPPWVACCITLGYWADNTSGNARETRNWMQKQGYRSLRLVTANYHMRRSLLEFQREMPDIRIVQHAVFPDGFKREDWWQWRGTFALTFIEYNKYLATLARPLLPFDPGADLT